MSKLPKLPSESVWKVFPGLAKQYNAINLGQGFPMYQKDAPAQYIVDAAKKALDVPILNQYALCNGHPRLQNALAEHYGPKFGRTLNPTTEVGVTVGATEGIYLSSHVLTPGDSILLLQPFYDLYPLAAKYAGVHSKYASIAPEPGSTSSETWKVDFEHLEKVILDNSSHPDYAQGRTSAILLNNPVNPVGKVFDLDELNNFAYLAKKHDLTVIADEVYDSIVYDEMPFHPFCSLPDMWERTITLGSAGKTFSATGWKIGFLFGPENLVQKCMNLHLANTFSVATPLQEAIAIGFEDAEAHNYFQNHLARFETTKNWICQELKNMGMKPIVPQGGYFVLVDTSNWDIGIPLDVSEPDNGSQESPEPRDWQICRKLVTDYNVVAIPPSAFYANDFQDFGQAGNYIRLCFCKEMSILESALEQLRKIPLKN